ncbi:MAG: hypothetical protein AB1765_05565 [Candidatus Hydrogenedentota bacterium]
MAAQIQPINGIQNNEDRIRAQVQAANQTTEQQIPRGVVEPTNTTGSVYEQIRERVLEEALGNNGQGQQLNIIA